MVLCAVLSSVAGIINIMSRMTRRSAKRPRITTGVVVIVQSIIEVHHLIRQREPDADRFRFGAYPPQFRPTECGQLEPDRLAVSPAASSMISAVISSCRTFCCLARSAESWRSI
jgi:hypothetical protein